MRRKISISILITLVTVVNGFSALAAAKGVEKVNPKIEFKAKPFNLNQVRLLDSPFKVAQEAMRQYLHKLESERLLHNFRINAGLPTEAEPLGGWEQRELRGHSMGHYLSACAMMYASTGDEKLKEKAEKIVAGLAECQKALGDSGYLSAYPESFIERAEKSQRVWAPYYTLHKIYAGLIDMYVHCGSEQSLEVAKGMAKWVKGRTDNLTEEQMQTMLEHTEQGGMNEALCNLYVVTGDSEIFEVARRFDQNSYTEPLYNREDNMTGQHVNSFIPNIVGTAREYELTGNEKELKIALYFWDQVANHRSYATGGTSNHERWTTKADILANELSSNTHETCCTYNILKLTRHLFMWEPEAEYADFYERGLYNGILATINPENAMTMYYVPMISGLFKTFCTPFDSFWCCTGTGMENPAKYGDSIYFYDDKGIFVNLFIASELNWGEKGTVIRQETKFPEQEGTSLIFKIEDKEEILLRVRIRIPYWAQKGVTVKINGNRQDVIARPSTYLSLERIWKDGDRIDIEMPMDLHLQPMPDDKSVAAIMYGPLVLAGELGSDGMTDSRMYGHYSFGEGRVEAPVMVSLGKDAGEWVKPLAGEPLRFHTVNAGRPLDVTLIPFHRLFGQRYAIYWKLYTESEWKDVKEKLDRAKAIEGDRKARIFDFVEIGGSQPSESEKAHRIEGENIARGEYSGRVWVQANSGGWLSYIIKVLPDKPMSLMCTYWGADVGDRKFDIYVEGEKIATQRIHELSPGQFVDIEYDIPQALTRDKERVKVKFEPYMGNTAGGIFGINMLKPKN